MHAANCIRQFTRRLRLQYVSRYASIERTTQVACARKGREDDHANRWMSAQPVSNIESGHPRHFDVSDDHIRSELTCGIQRGLPVGHLRNDVDIVLQGEERRESPQHHALIFSEYDANHFVTAAGFTTDLRAPGSKPSS